MNLDFFHTAILCGLVFFGGFVDSIGGGGGLITIPAYFAFGLPPHTALATNKFSSSMGTLAAAVRYYHAGTMNIRIGLAAAAGSMAGSVAGARLAMLTPADVINTIILFLVPSILVFFLLKDRFAARFFPDRKQSPAAENASGYATAVSIGVVIGVYDGFFGPGTGTFLAIAFSTFLGMDLLTSSANARLANLASNLGSLAVFLAGGKVLFPLAFFVAASGVAGNLLGSSLAVRKGAAIIKPLMTVALVLLLGEVIRRRFF